MANPHVRPYLHFYPEDAGKTVSEYWHGRHWHDNVDPIVVTPMAHQQEHSLLPGFLLVPSRKAVQVAQVHKSNIGLLFNIHFNNIYLFD